MKKSRVITSSKTKRNWLLISLTPVIWKEIFYLTAQLIEMRVPMIVVVNMLDVAAAHKIEINIENLQRDLNCKVVGIVASKEEGLKELCEAIDEQLSMTLKLLLIQLRSILISRKPLSKLALYWRSRMLRNLSGLQSSFLKGTKNFSLVFMALT